MPDNIDIRSGKEHLLIADVRQMLEKTYWCPDITENEIIKGIDHSALLVGAYADNVRQIGFLRVVSDKVRFAYLQDVVVDESHQHRGIARRMVNFALSHPEMKDVYQWFLMTTDAHGVYEPCGFQPLKNPEKWMSIVKPRPDRTRFEG